MALDRQKPHKSHYTTRYPISQSRNSPTNSGEEARKSPPPSHQKISLDLLCVANGPCAFKLIWQFPFCTAGGDKAAPDSCSGCPGGALSLVYDNIPLAFCCGHFPPPNDIIRITITN